jgi:hypothetical protein
MNIDMQQALRRRAKSVRIGAMSAEKAARCATKLGHPVGNQRAQPTSDTEWQATPQLDGKFELAVIAAEIAR